MKKNKTDWGTLTLLVGLCLVSIILMMVPSYILLVKPRGQAFDLFWIWAGGRAVLTGHNPYGPETTRTIQLGVLGYLIPPGEYQHGFPHPAHIAFVLLPFVSLPFFWSVLLWTSLQIPLFMLAMGLGLKLLQWAGHRPYFLFLLAMVMLLGFRYPMNVYVLGQLTIFVLCCSLLAAWLWQQQQPRWAAIALAGATIRPDLSLLAFLLALILTRNSPRRNQFIGTLLIAGLILALLPVLFIGLWPLEWIRAIRTYGHNPFATWPPGLLPAPWLVAGLLLGAVVWWGRYLSLAWRKPSLFSDSLLVSATILAGLIILPQTGNYILTLALLPALILWRYAQPAWLRWLIAASLLTPWLYFSLGASFDRLIFLLIPGQFVILQELVSRWPRLA